MFQTEYPFTLPLGFVDKDGNLHREGVMRLATSVDEIAPLADPRVQTNQAYFVVILLSRVVTRLGSVEVINPKVVEGLFAADLQYLQELYSRINGNGTHVQKVACPSCHQEFEVESAASGGS